MPARVSGWTAIFMTDIATLLQQTAARPSTTPIANVTATTRHHTPTARVSTWKAAILTDIVIIIRILVSISRTAGSVIITEVICTGRNVNVEVESLECIRHTDFAIIIYFNRVKQTEIFTVKFTFTKKLLFLMDRC